MRLILERRAAPSRLAVLLSPLVAVALTLAAGAAMLGLMGRSPAEALAVYFVSPLADGWALQEIAVKAAPLVLIGVGLALCYVANVWNIGAEGQFLAGAVVGGAVALATHGGPGGAWVLPAMLLAGMAGGALWALVPALLKVRFGASEILTSLMLVYVAELALDWLVRGPWRDPRGFGFPQTVRFDPDATIPLLVAGGRLNLGAVFALVAVAGAALVMRWTVAGFALRLEGEAPRAARFAGFGEGRATIAVFLVSGALAGLAGIVEAAGTVGQLQPALSPGYGFTAIIVAFLGRLNPFGVLVAGLFLALTFIGGENAQIALRLPLDVTRAFQGLLLFFVLACDAASQFRVRVVREAAA
jgi:simple sugar transport system permease protein